MPSNTVTTAFKSSNSSINAQWACDRGATVQYYTDADIKTDRCHLKFNIPDTMGPPVLFFYHLTNFYQNHRRYVDSFDADQLKGTAKSWGDIDNSKCTPLKGDKDDKKPYYPCGLIANSMFNDSFTSPSMLNAPGGDDEPRVYLMDNNTNIAWDSDKALYGETKYGPDDVLPPPNWAERYPGGVYTDTNKPPDLKNWEAFQVWMRTAGLPTFSKLYQRNDSTKMEPGTYEVIVDDRRFIPYQKCTYSS